LDEAFQIQRTPRKIHPIRRAILRGLGIALPPLLTIIVFLWAWALLEDYVLQPLEGGARYLIVAVKAEIRETPPPPLEAIRYARLDNGQWIPRDVFERVNISPGEHRPQTGRAYYNRYVDLEYLPRTRTIPLFLIAFVLTLYLLGKFLAAGIGRWMWHTFEAMIRRLPVVRNVYTSVKQVTDFIFSEQEVQFSRVVAVEYPRKGIWSIGFVTGEGMYDIRTASNEPIMSVLMPTSPMPMTGFTVMVRKSETIDLNISIDQAIQFVVSCGVVIPESQLPPKPRALQPPAVMFAKSPLPTGDAAAKSATDGNGAPGGDAAKNSSAPQDPSRHA
jgi:uncharacterized membrane protein